MEKLMKPAEYAKELGISRQAVYAKIKRGILTAKNVDGKLYIVVDKEMAKEKAPAASEDKKATAASTAARSKEPHKDYRALLEAKDETIAVLKDTVKDLKESNKQISTTLRGEIDLLKEAFHEMRTLYVHQLGHKENSDAIDVEEHEGTHEESIVEESIAKEKWVGLRKFFKQLDITKEKQQDKLTKALKKAYKKGDKRLAKEKGKIRINTAVDYRDLID